MPKGVYWSVAVVSILAIVWIPTLAADKHQGHSKHRDATTTASVKEGHAGHKAPAKALAEAMEAIDAARQAVEANDKDKALTHLKKAKELVAACHKAMSQMGKGKFVNTRCPIMGTKLDASKVPAKLTTTFKGGKVGFCCAGCPSAWDKLSDEDKEQKLRKSVAADAPGQGKPMEMDKKKGHGDH